MGAWGAGSFDNDEALDWVWTLASDTDGSVIRAALEAVASDEDIEADTAASALAAVEIVAARSAERAAALPPEAQAWLTAHGASITPALVDLARASVLRVRDHSELRELWDEAEDPTWLAAVDDLLTRLG